MIVCHCHAVTDRDIRRAADGGARSCSEIRQACKAGGDCGGCRAQVQLILKGLCDAQPEPAQLTHSDHAVAV